MKCLDGAGSQAGLILSWWEAGRYGGDQSRVKHGTMAKEIQDINLI